MAQLPPELQTLLATLAQGTPQVDAPQPRPDAHIPYITAPNATPVPIERSQTSTPQYGAPPRSHDLRLKPQNRTAAASPKVMIDPATITVWKDALRCVTKLAQQNAEFEHRIRKMIENQRKNEMSWYQQRQDLKKAHATGPSSSTQVASILANLNGETTIPENTVDDETAKQTELAALDRKIYAAQVSMEEAMTAELKGLGVPFFGTDPDLILEEGRESESGAVPAGRLECSRLVTKGEMVGLRRRIVEHLEVLYRDT
ncbi:Protein of unknown function (DUF2458) [Teratosphaeria destructans]|uniref:Uncharacterized protein n=1 Tax=Teratosphaeria destructans TaxID=418781 RepID=A0A9W7SPV6_9PEZI|nr:Protein of unknown function (DUF2458) [Teratosphaeria destructans]